MKRIHGIAAGVALATALWLAALRADLGDRERVVVALLPLLSIAALGLYALALLAAGVASFRDCPGDADALQADIKAARADLAARGVPVPRK